jgi:sodium-dependent dicarboxylate transporter 2/3/5
MLRVNHDQPEDMDVRERDETRERITGPAPSEDEEPGSTPTQRIGLVAGLALFVLMQLLPEPVALSVEGWAVAGVAILMAVWWLTEAVPIPVTAMLPLVLFPILGVATMSRAAAPYANEAIYLFMGGFFLGKAIEKWSLHRRIALAIIVRIGTSPRRLLLGVMVATALVSMWISNTATAAMMLPIALAVGHMFRPTDDGSTLQKPYNFGIALMLGVAYSASIGGVGTLIGTPPNILFAAAASELLGVRISLLQWMMVGVPVTCIMLPLAWLILLKVYPPEELSGDAHAAIQAQRKLLGPPSRAERFVGLVFALTVLAWVMREPKVLGAVSVPGIATLLPGVTDGTIAMLAALILFVVPLDWRRGHVALDWGTAVTIPWGVLVLFGGGLALADAMGTTDLSEWIGSGVAILAGAPTIVMLAAASALFILLGEVTSNTAMAAMALPVMAGMAAPVGIPPLVLMGTVAIACSMGFCLPAGTPPNAIVFGSGYVTIGQMVRAGIWVDVLSIAVVTLVATFLLPVVFGS